MRLLSDLHEFGAGIDGVDQRRQRVELLAQLVEIRDMEVDALAHGSPVRLDFAQDELQQRALARAVGSDEADPVAADHARREIADQRAVAVILADGQQFGHQLARAFAGGQLQVHPAQAFAPRRAFAPQRFEPQHAALVARPACLDALANPRLFLGQHLVGLGVDHGLVFQLAGLALLVRREIARIGEQAAAVELDDARGDRVEEAPVVADAHDGAIEVLQQLLEPSDGGEVEMVRRLVQQQHVGRADQRLRQRHALLPAAGQIGYGSIRWQFELPEHGVDAVRQRPAAAFVEPALQRIHAGKARRAIAVRKQRQRVMVVRQQPALVTEAERDGIEDREIRVERRLLHHACDARAGRDPGVAGIQIGDSRQDAQQRRLAGAVAADEPDAFAGIELEIGGVEQRMVAERQAGARQRQERHARLKLAVRSTSSRSINGRHTRGSGCTARDVEPSASRM